MSISGFCYLPAVEASIPVVTLSASSLDFRSNAFRSSMLTAASTFCMQLAYIASGGGGGGGVSVWRTKGARERRWGEW